jgi:hypothetical protein
MPERFDLRQIAENIQEALAGYDRDALLEMLTYVFKEYVIEGAPPVLVSQVDGIDGLEGLPFARLIETLQSRLDVPELGQFQVSGDQVLVRVGGVLTPIDDGDPGAAAPPRPAPSAAPRQAPAADSRATAAEAERRGRGDLAGGQRGVVQAPPPRGVSVSSRPAVGAGGGRVPDAPAPSPPAPAAEPETPEGAREGAGDDDASVRFSLLELD